MYNIEKFYLDQDTTYDKYVYIARHGVIVPIEKLVPFDEFPALLEMQYIAFEDPSLGLIHGYCIMAVDKRDGESSLISMDRQIRSAIDFVELVIERKSKLWCVYRAKAVFPLPRHIVCQRFII